jgi:hypothetical protein
MFPSGVFQLSRKWRLEILVKKLGISYIKRFHNIYIWYGYSNNYKIIAKMSILKFCVRNLEAKSKLFVGISVTVSETR